MKVKELISILKKLDKEKEIALKTESCMAFEIREVKEDEHIKKYVILP